MKNLISRRINAFERDDVVDALKRQHIIVRLVVAGESNRAGIHRSGRRIGRVAAVSARLRPRSGVSAGRVAIPRCRLRPGSVIVEGKIAGHERHGFDAGLLPERIILQSRSLTAADRHAAAQIGQIKNADAVAAVSRADQRVKRVVLRNLKLRAVTESPAANGESAAKQSDFSEIWT